MKKATLPTLLAFVLATAVYAMAIPYLSEVQQQRRATQVDLGEIPAEVVRAFSFEFKGVVADFLMLQAMTFMGERIGENRSLSLEEWHYLHRLLSKITEIDQGFWDPYLFAETMLVWQAGMVEEANQLLLKAAAHRPWDYRPSYFLGFNYFYFLKDAPKAAFHLRNAAKAPGAPYYLQGMAARFSLYGNQTEAGLIFLDDLIRQTSDPGIRKYLEKRFAALKIIFELEKKAQEFNKANGRMPQSFEEMITAGVLEKVPEDPYGGEFVLLGNGRIYTTSELVDKKPEK